MSEINYRWNPIPFILKMIQKWTYISIFSVVWIIQFSFTNIRNNKWLFITTLPLIGIDLLFSPSFFLIYNMYQYDFCPVLSLMYLSIFTLPQSVSAYSIYYSLAVFPVTKSGIHFHNDFLILWTPTVNTHPDSLLIVHWPFNRRILSYTLSCTNIFSSFL